jgi:hypothetical protein
MNAFVYEKGIPIPSDQAGKMIFPTIYGRSKS